jgi:signal transduction histidine kinase
MNNETCTYSGNQASSQQFSDSNAGNSSLDQRERLLAMGQMAASLAHEIRNPLGSMELNLSLLRKELKANEDLSGIVEQVLKSVSTLNHIVSNCLLFTKDITVRKRKFNTAFQMLDETCKYLAQSRTGVRFKGFSKIDYDFESSRGIELAWAERGTLPFLMDPYLIGQIAINLINNSIDACGSETGSGRSLSVIIEVIHESSSEWELVVADTGSGMNADTISRMYDPFFTTKEKGTGLGLAIVHSLVTAHDGTIHIESEAGKGTRIHVKFRNI